MRETNEQELLRKYILGKIGDDEQKSAIEERIMTDDDYFQKLAMVEEDVIQDYVDENLDPADRANFEKCFLISTENRQKVKFARALRKYVDETKAAPDEKKKPSVFAALKAFFSSPVPATLAVLIILGFAGFFIWKSFSSSKDSEILVALNKAYRSERPVESRVTDLDYAPPKNTRGDESKTDKIQLRLAIELALTAVSENPSATNLHALGRVYIAERNFDNAIEQLERAVNLAPDDAKIHNDLGVALMEKAKISSEGYLENYAKANEQFTKAIELDKNLLDAYFNQALVTKELNSPVQAKEAWQKYLELDSTSEWADEARKNLEMLESNQPVGKTKEEILQKFLQARQSGDEEIAWQTLKRNREIKSGKLIPQQLAFLFVEAKSNRNEADAKKFLDALGYAGRLEAEKTGDSFWQDSAEYYLKVTDAAIPLLKQAQTDLNKAYEFYQKGDYSAAKQLFENSKKGFELAGNISQSKICDYWIGSSLFYSNQIDENLAVYQELADFCQKKNYKWLLSIVYARIGYSFSSKNQISDALAYPKKSLEIAKSLQDDVGIKKFSAQIAGNYRNVGRTDESFRYLENFLAINSSDLEWLDYEILSAVSYKQKFYNTAFVFEKAAIEKAFEKASDVNQQISYVNLAIISASQNKYDEAENFIDNSLQIAQKFSDSENRKKSLAYSNLQLAHIKRLAQKYDESLKYYDEAVNFYDLSEFSLDKYDAYKGRLLCFLAQKNKSAFEKELPIIFKLVEEYRTNILEEQNRNSFFNDEQDVYDIAINYAYDENNYAEAFNYSEKSRSRSLLDLQESIVEVSTAESLPEIKLSKNISEPLTLAEIQTQIPENVQLLQFTVLSDKVLIWLITKNGIDIAKSEIPSDTLGEKVFAYIDLVSGNNDENEQLKLSKELYQILISPIKEKLDSNKEIFLIPDKFLFHLPFAALFSEKYFIEEYKMSVTPSASIFVICTRKAKEFEAKKDEKFLSIGNPAFRRELFKNLVPLPTARKEAIESAKFYVAPLVLPEGEATKDRIKPNLANSDVIQFAGHYIVNENSPLLSGFVLAGNDSQSATLANYEIIGEKLSHTRLIVLSACRTGVEKYYNGEGLIGASRTFLATGVPLVVASQWQVDSDAASEIMINFHRLRKTENLSTTDALRQSQLAILQNDEYQNPYYWAAFMTLGGYARF